MKAPSLTRLKIENLRGAIVPFTLKFEKDRKLTIIYGENGTGKSTISDALDLLGNDNVGSLDKRGIGGTKPYWPSIGKIHSDVKVLLETASGECTLSLSSSKSVLDNEHLRPQVSILRRSEILHLITAIASERYKALSKFIDVSSIEASEATLRKLISDKTRDYETATTRLGENKTAIENFWQQVNSPAPDAFTWAESEVQKDQQQLEQRRVSIDGLIALWDKVVPHPQSYAELVQSKRNVGQTLATAQASLTIVTSNTADEYLETLEILKVAQQHFNNHPNPQTCPLCESAEKISGLVAEVNRRIDSQGQYAKLDEAKKLVTQEQTALQREQQRVDDFLIKAIKDFESLNTYLTTQADELIGLNLPSLPSNFEPEQWANWIEDNKVHRENWRQAADVCMDSKNFISTLERSLGNYKNSQEDAQHLGLVLPRLKEVLAIIESERKKYTDSILSEISSRVGELYDDIHPSEGLNKIVLALDAAKRGSLEIATEFGGKSDTPPQAYFSDSHLDTLGLCVFLALAERETPEQKILVLDDVLGSVDEPHVERVISLIYEVSQKFLHTIVTTHYRPWREKFRWGLLKPDQVCQFIELKHWSLIKGISQTGSINEITRLKTLLADSEPDIQSVTSKAGVVLEATLDYLTLKYGCAVPRNPRNNYVLSELLSSINGKLSDALKVEVFADGESGVQEVTTVAIKPILENIKGIAQARNVLGAHFNDLSFELYPEDGIRFAKHVVELSEALICPEYGWPNKDTGSYWRNSGDTRRLHPLKKPS